MKSCAIVVLLGSVVVYGYFTTRPSALDENSFNVNCESGYDSFTSAIFLFNECRDIRDCRAAEASLAMGGVPTQCGWADDEGRRIPKVCCGLPLVLGEELLTKVYQEKLRNRAIPPPTAEDSFNIYCETRSYFESVTKTIYNECRDIRDCRDAEASLAIGGVPKLCGWADDAARKVPKVCCGLPLVLGEELSTKVDQEKLRNRAPGFGRCPHPVRVGPEGDTQGVLRSTLVLGEEHRAKVDQEKLPNRGCGQKYPSEFSETEYKFNLILQSLPEDINPPKSNEMYASPVGGKLALEGVYPWMVSICKNGSHWCGGTLVNWTHILSAAHCFLDRDPKHYQVRIGSVDIEGGRLFDVVKIVVHERYLEGQHYNDIAMVTVSKEILDQEISRVCLPHLKIASMDLTGENTSLLGWGDTSFNGTSTPVLHVVEPMSVTSTRACARKYRRFTRDTLPRGLTSDFICAGLPEGGKDACQKDSGGPLFYKDYEENTWYVKRDVLVGIVSFGYFCGEPGFPGVYTRVTSHMDWITRNMQL